MGNERSVDERPIREWAEEKMRWADDRRTEPGQRSYAFNVADKAVRLLHEQVIENERLRETLHTAWMMVRSDATDAPGCISTAIRPFLEAAHFGSSEAPPCP
jgi:hypothetical protein